jgi:hypothetical protein
MEPLLFSLMSLRGENGFNEFQRVTSANYFIVASPARTIDLNPASIKRETHGLDNETRISTLFCA